MTTSQKNAFLSEILEGKPIPLGKLSYFRARLKNELYDAVITHFLEKNISKAELARRLGKKPEQITRWLSSPGNWTLDTLSDLLLGMKCEPSISVVDLERHATETNVTVGRQPLAKASPIATSPNVHEVINTRIGARIPSRTPSHRKYAAFTQSHYRHAA